MKTTLNTDEDNPDHSDEDGPEESNSTTLQAIGSSNGEAGDHSSRQDVLPEQRKWLHIVCSRSNRSNSFLDWKAQVLMTKAKEAQGTVVPVADIGRGSGDLRLGLTDNRHNCLTSNSNWMYVKHDFTLRLICFVCDKKLILIYSGNICWCNKLWNNTLGCVSIPIKLFCIELSPLWVRRV